jgi:hypothetical protein
MVPEFTKRSLCQCVSPSNDGVFSVKAEITVWMFEDHKHRNLFTHTPNRIVKDRKLPAQIVDR